MFDSENMPFVGFIVGTYSNSIDHKSQFTSLLRCFMLEVEEDKEKRKDDCDRDDDDKKIPFEIKTTLIPQEFVDVHVIDYINYILREIEMDDGFDNNWKGSLTKRDKMRTCITNLFKINSKDLKEFKFEEVINKTEASESFKNLGSTDSNAFFSAINRLKQRHVNHPKFNELNTKSNNENKIENVEENRINTENHESDPKLIS